MQENAEADKVTNFFCFAVKYTISHKILFAVDQDAAYIWGQSSNSCTWDEIMSSKVHGWKFRKKMQ